MFSLLSFQLPAWNPILRPNTDIRMKAQSSLALLTAGDTMECLCPAAPSPVILPWPGHFQLPCPSPPLGLSVLHKNHQAKQEQNEFCKIRHFVNIYDATSCIPGTCLGANPPGLAIGKSVASWQHSLEGPRGLGWPGWSSRFTFDTDACPTPPLPSPGCDSNKCQGFALPAA